jgi:hypothetical protein
MQPKEELKRKHNYYIPTIKKLIGIEPDPKKQNTFQKLHDFIVENSDKIAPFLRKDARGQINPNSILFLKNCGFDFMKIKRHNRVGGDSYYYDIIENGNIVFAVEYPSQVYYTNRIIEELKKHGHFRDNYMEGDFISTDLIQIEDVITNHSDVFECAFLYGFVWFCIKAIPKVASNGDF